MRHIIIRKINYNIGILCLLCLCLMFASCTRYTGNVTTTTTTTTGTGSSSNGSGATPLPPLAGGGTGTGSSGTGGGTVNPNIPQAYVQGFNFTDFTGGYININDSTNLLGNGSYTTLYAGTNVFKYKVSTTTYTTASYYLRPYSFYTYVVFKSPASVAGETLLWNDATTPAAGTAQVRFISLDPLTTASPITFKLTNYLDNVIVPNRTYLDNRTDSTQNYFRTITPGFSNVSFLYKDSTMLTFTQNFESGRKYTVFAGALSYIASSKGTLPINYYQIARHN